MNTELVLKQFDNEVYIDSRDVALLIGKEHSKLLRDIRTYVEYLNEANIGLVEFLKETSYIDAKGESRTCFLITKKGCDMIANKLTGAKGVVFTAKYVTAFEHMRTKLSTKQDSYMIEDPVARAKRWIDEYNEKLLLLEENALLKPKAEFHDAVDASENTISFGKFSAVLQNNKDVNIGRNKILKWCRENGYLCSSPDLKNKPSQQMLQSGYMKYSENIVVHKENIRTTYTPLLTGKGQIWLTREVLNNLKNE